LRLLLVDLESERRGDHEHLDDSVHPDHDHDDHQGQGEAGAQGQAPRSR